MSDTTYQIYHLFEHDKVTTDERNSRVTSCEASYVVYTSSPVSESDVIAAMRDSTDIPTTYLNCRISSIKSDEHCNPLLWKMSVSYSRSTVVHEWTSLNKEYISYDFGTHQGHADVSLEVANTYGVAPDQDNRINVDADGETHGIDMYLPCASMTIVKRFRKSQFESSIRNKIIFRRGRVNDASFKGFSTGEVLFVGAQIRESSDDDDAYEVTFNFLINENESNISFGTHVTGVSKEGWQALAPHYTRKSKTQVIIDGVYVHKLYKKADFTEMGLSSHV